MPAVGVDGNRLNTGDNPVYHYKFQEKTNMKISPLDDRLVIKPAEAETKTATGIVLPETAKEKPTRGKVISTGPGRMLDNGQRAAVSVKVGEEVYYGKYAGTEIKINDEAFVIVRESDLLGVVEK
jgi:chaperonin GroES